MAPASIVQRAILAFLPSPGREDTKRAGLARLIKGLRGDPAYDPLRDRLKPAFAAAVLELKGIAARLRSVYLPTISGSDEQRSATELDLFRRTLSTLDLDIDSFRFRSIEDEAGHGGRSGVSEIGRVFTERATRLAGFVLDGLLVGTSERTVFIEREGRRDLESRMRDVFGTMILAPFDGYNEEVNRSLHGADLPGWRHIMPMHALKNFFRLRYEESVQPVLRALAIEAEYEGEDFRTMLGELVEKVERLERDVAKFEEDLVSPSYSRIRPFIVQIERGALENAAKPRVRRTVDAINDEAEELIRRAFLGLTGLHGALAKLEIDLRSRRPAVLTNAAALVAAKSGCATGIEEAVATVARAVRLLRAFVDELGNEGESA